MIVHAPETKKSNSLLNEISTSKFAVNFDKKPFEIGHNLADHEAFDLERLVDLSKLLPTDSVEYNSGDLPVSQDPAKTPMNGLSPEQTIQRIQECKSWLVLKNVEQVPEYRMLLDACLDEIESATAEIAPGMTRREGFIFVSSPGSVTPYHIDPENNFLLQVRGQKQVHMYDPMDRDVLSESDIEEFFSGAHRNLNFNDSIHGRGYWFNLQPGQGLHFPVVAPHWVENGKDVSISFSITFQTDASMRRQTLHRFNRRLRKLGVTPSPVGFNENRDKTKFFFLNAARKLKSVGR